MVETSKKLKVFVSYSRRDLEFADQLVALLEWQAFDANFDREGIHGAEKWEQRLGQLILESDIVVFVLSPESARSDICAWEVEEATRRGKRIIPVLCRPLDGAQPPARLRDLNYIHFYAEKDVPGSGFATGQIRLIDALSVDVAWLREHTRLEELAARWDNNRRPVDQLLRGSELAAYQGWRDRRPANAPDLTTLQRAFLAMSEEEETSRTSAERKRLDEMAAAQAEREKALVDRANALARATTEQRRRRVLTLSALVSVTIVAAVAGWQWWQAARTRDELEVRQLTFIAAEVNRLHNQGAVGELRAIIAEVLPEPFRKKNTLGEEEEKAFTLRTGRTTAPLLELRSTAFLSALSGMPIQRRSLGVHGINDKRSDRIDTAAAYSPDGLLVATAGTDNIIRIWHAESGALVRSLRGHNVSPIVGAIALTWDIFPSAIEPWKQIANLFPMQQITQFLSNETTKIRTCVKVGQEFIGGAKFDRERNVLASESDNPITLFGLILSVEFSPDGKLVASAGADNTVRVWRVDSGELLHTLRHRSILGSFEQQWAWARENGDIGDNGRPRHAISPSNFAGQCLAALLNELPPESAAKIWRLVHDSLGVVTRARFSPDGRWLVSVGSDNTARLWSVETGLQIAEMQGHKVVNALARNAEAFGGEPLPGTTATSTPAEFDEAFQKWLTSDDVPLPLREVIEHMGILLDVAFSPDGNSIAFSGLDSRPQIWTPESGKMQSMPGHLPMFPGSRGGGLGPVLAVAFSPDGKLLTSAGMDNTARVWSLMDGALVYTLEGSSANRIRIDHPALNEKQLGAVTALEFSRDSQHLLTAGTDSFAVIWSMRDGTAVKRHSAKFRGLLLARMLNGISGVAAGRIEGLTVFGDDQESNAGSVQLPGDGLVHLLVPSPDRRSILSLSLDNPPVITDLAAKKEVDFRSQQDLAELMRWQAHRCVPLDMRRRLFLPEAPPRWCITGYGREQQPPESWRGKWPYHGEAWRRWQQARDRGINEPLP